MAPGAQGFGVAQDVSPPGPLAVGGPLVAAKGRIAAHTRRMARAVIPPALAFPPGPLEELFHEGWRGGFRHKGSLPVHFNGAPRRRANSIWAEDMTVVLHPPLHLSLKGERIFQAGGRKMARPEVRGAPRGRANTIIAEYMTIVLTLLGTVR
jgi:hypothetical protein